MSGSRGSLTCKATGEKRHAGMCTLVSSSPQGRGVACADHVVWPEHLQFSGEATWSGPWLCHSRPGVLG